MLKTARALLGTIKDFRSISLTLFILKLLERLIGRYIREVFFVRNRREPHDYQGGKYAKTALVKVVTEIEKRFKSSFTLSVLLDIEDVFNHICEEHLSGCQET